MIRLDQPGTYLEELGSVLDRGPCALIHEAALWAWGLDNHVSPMALDVLASQGAVDAAALLRLGWSLMKVGDDAVWALKPPRAPALRIWSSLGGAAYESYSFIRSRFDGWRVLDPAAVLDALPFSPDFPLLLEQRAALAATLFFDDMDDAELREFYRYVRLL